MLTNVTEFIQDLDVGNFNEKFGVAFLIKGVSGKLKSKQN